MENIKEKIEELTDHTKEYLETLYDLSMVRVTQKVANTASIAVSSFIAIIFVLLVLFLGGIGLGWWLGGLLNNMAAGFLIVAGFYLLCLIFVFVFGKKIILPVIRNRIVKKIYE